MFNVFLFLFLFLFLEWVSWLQWTCSPWWVQHDTLWISCYSVRLWLEFHVFSSLYSRVQSLYQYVQKDCRTFVSDSDRISISKSSRLVVTEESSWNNLMTDMISCSWFFFRKLVIKMQRIFFTIMKYYTLEISIDNVMYFCHFHRHVAEKAAQHRTWLLTW